MKTGWKEKLVRSLEMALPYAKGPTYGDLVYADVEGRELCLDLYLPFWKSNCPLVVYFHGGGWSSGSYKDRGMSWLVGYGFAVASVQYRLTDEAQFPAQIHDAKGAIRWLRANAKQFSYDASRMGAVGVSSGGHIAMLAGLAEVGGELEGNVGGNGSESSQVDVVVNYFGATDLVLRSQTQPEATEPVGSIVHKLLGQSVSQDEEWAKLASPAFHVSGSAPPLLVIHGVDDPQVKVDQAYRIVEEYERAQQGVTLELVAEGGHGGPEFFNHSFREKVAAFLQQHLQSSGRVAKVPNET